MPVTKDCRWRCIASALMVGLVLFGSGDEAAGQEHLRAEAPVAESLADQVTTAQQTFAEPKAILVPETPFMRKVLTGLHEATPRLTPLGRDEVLTLAPRMYYRHVGRRSGGTSYEAAIGGSLGLLSGWLGDEDIAIRYGLTGYLSEKLVAGDDPQGLGLLRPGGEGYSALGEIYLESRIRGASIAGGRRALTLPFININDSRMTPNTFEFLGARFEPFPGLKFGAGHITRIKDRTSSNFEWMSTVAGAEGSEHGVSFAGLQWEPRADTVVAAINEYGWHTYNTFFAEADILWKRRGEWDFRVGLQGVDQRSVGDELVGEFDAQFGAVRTSAGRRGFIASLAATASSNQANVRNPWGGHPSYNSLMISNFARPGEKSVRLGLTWNGAAYGLERWSGFTSYAFGDARNASDQHEVNATVDYRVAKGYFEGLWIRARAAWNSTEGQGELTDVRVIVNYSFDF